MKIFLVSMSFLMSSLSFAGDVRFVSPASQLTWKGSKVVGGGHEGHLKIKKGKVHFDKGMPQKARFVVDMTSLTNTDLKDPSWNKKLVGHLKSDDFFSIEKFPEAELTIRQFKKVKADTYQLLGDLTIKGVTKPVDFVAKMKNPNDFSEVVADLKFDRTDFGVRYGSGKFFDDLGDKMISDEVMVRIHLKLEKSKS